MNKGMKQVPYKFFFFILIFHDKTSIFQEIKYLFIKILFSSNLDIWIQIPIEEKCTSNWIHQHFFLHGIPVSHGFCEQWSTNNHWFTKKKRFEDGLDYRLSIGR